MKENVRGLRLDFSTFIELSAVYLLIFLATMIMRGDLITS
jgi:hypothetical protein